MTRTENDEIIYRTNWGHGPTKTAKIVSTGIEEGQIYYNLDDKHWCFGHQIGADGKSPDCPQLKIVRALDKKGVEFDAQIWVEENDDE